MSHIATPNQTPNVVIESPRIREVLNNIIGIIGALIFVAVAVDVATDAFDISAITTPALAGVTAVASAFSLGVTRANYPR